MQRLWHRGLDQSAWGNWWLDPTVEALAFLQTVGASCVNYSINNAGACRVGHDLSLCRASCKGILGMATARASECQCCLGKGFSGRGTPRNDAESLQIEKRSLRRLHSQVKTKISCQHFLQRRRRSQRWQERFEQQKQA